MPSRASPRSSSARRFLQRTNLHMHSATPCALAAADVDPIDHAVISVEPPVLERVEQAFEKVVEVATPSIRRIHRDQHRERSRHRRATHGEQCRLHRCAVLPTGSADQCRATDAPVVVIG
nr:hypothetical protein [Leptolyngbya sp. 7M]